MNAMAPKLAPRCTVQCTEEKDLRLAMANSSRLGAEAVEKLFS